MSKFKDYLLHNPYWGVFHLSAENQTFGPVDPSQFPSISETEIELIKIWNDLTVNKRKELARVVEESIDADE
ncbi:MAG: hypothetical protein ABI999_11510 [Acidobacteriota bacterium]